jgi:hypothetical protein
MRFLSFVIFLVIGSICIFPQSPHGKNLKIDCSYCHESTQWKIIPKNIKFNHNKETSFKLTGQHIEVDCRSCHKSLIFSEVKSECISCHKDVHQNTLGPDCERCHTTNTWIVSNIIQVHQNSRFPLVGVHLNVDCRSCHSSYDNLLFPPQSISCFSCHSKQYYATTSPNHAQSNFSTNCDDCHSMTSFTWGNTNFDHSFFPLVGGHNLTNCFSCHKQNAGFKGLTTDCYLCHNQQFLQAKNPDHVQAKFSTACQECHNIYSFTQATFNHSTTGFPLTGAHASTTCQSCHTNGYTNTSSDCYSCHSNDFAGTTDPNHVTQGFSHDCSQCHSTTNWGDANFDHSTTGFPLVGAHASTTCQSCHAAGYATPPPPACYSCHQSKYQGTTNPNHTAAGLPQTCQDCHNTTAWTPSTFNHTNTGFTLTGAHVSLDCSFCHKGTVTGLTTDCYSCHSNDYAGTTDPNHVAQGFPHDCSQCHSTTNWSGATFDHSTTGFPLTGAHASISCQSCHISGYTNPPSTNCYNCHTTDYNNTNNPPHQSAGYPTDCAQCHTTTAWSPSTFDHTQYFPLTGSHNVSCKSCHQTISNFAIHSCNATCHKNAHHQNEDCYSCHKTGSGD